MSELWETLTTGLIVSLVFIGLSYLFWRRYDKPTPLMIERQEEKERLREEQRTWRQVEARLRAEQEETELRAAYERRKAEERSRAMVPVSTEVNDAWKSLGVSPLEQEPSTTFTAEGEDANATHRAIDQTDLAEGVADDADVLNAAELVQVRQDEGVQPGAEEPDWELIEKLNELAETDEVVVPDVPEAPDLEAAEPVHPASTDNDEESGDTATAVAPQTTPSPTNHGEDVESGAEDSLASSEPESPPARSSSSKPASDMVTWNLAEGEDLWGGTAWEEE